MKIVIKTLKLKQLEAMVFISASETSLVHKGINFDFVGEAQTNKEAISNALAGKIQLMLFPLDHIRIQPFTFQFTSPYAYNA